MKNKKIMILVIVVILTISMFFLVNKKNKNNEENTREIKIIGKKYLSINDYKKIEYNDNNYIIFSGNKGYILLDKKGNEIVQSKDKIEVLEDKVTKKEYYYTNNELFDMSTKKSIYKYNDYIEFVDNNYIAYTQDNHLLYLYNYETKKEYKDVEYESFDNISVLLYDNKYHVITNDGEKVYKNKEETSGGALFYNDDKDKIELKKFKDNKLELTKDFYLDLSNDCPLVKKYSDNTKISDECFYYDIEDGFDDSVFFDQSTDSKIGIIKKFKNNGISYSLFLFSNDKYIIEENIIEGRFSDNKYIYTKDSKKEYILDVNGKTIESKCAGELSVNNDIYVCSDIYDTYYMDNNFNKISDYYNSIECNKDGYCLIQQDGKYGINYENKEVVKPEYYDGIINDNYIILNTLMGYDIYILDSDKEIDKKELTPTIEIDNYDIDIDKTISDYKLEDIKDIIYNNKEDFCKYAYIVLNNNNLGNYKKQVLDYFKVYIDKKEYVNDSYFFYSLSTLIIKIPEKFVLDGANGLYHDDKNMIEISKESANYDHVIYHELMHFIDFRLSNISNVNIYLYNGKLISRDDYRKLSYDEKIKVEPIEKNNMFYKYFLEGGAEKNTAYTFFDGELSAYYYFVDEYNMLEYLFGQKAIEDVFYGNKNLYELFEKYYSLEEYDEFTKLSDDFIEAYFERNTTLKSKYKAELADKMIELYTKVYNKDVKEDKVMCYLLSNYIIKNYTSKDTKYYEVYKYILSLENKLKKSCFKTYSLDEKITSMGKIHFYNDKLYLYISYPDDKGFVEMKVEYDISNDKFNLVRKK